MQAATYRSDARNEWQVNPPAQQHDQFIPAPSDHRSRGWGSTAGQFCQSNILQLNPYQHDIRIRYPSQMNSSWDLWYLNLAGFDCWEVAKHMGISDCQSFTVSIPFRQATEIWLQSLREKWLLQKHYIIAFSITLLGTRVRQKIRD